MISSWRTTTLGEVGEIFCGQSPPSASVNRAGDGVSYVSGPEQWDGVKLHLNKWTTNPKRVAPDDSIFITVKGAGVGTLFPGTKAAIGRDIYAYQPGPELLPGFVLHALTWTIVDLKRQAVGDIPGLSKADIADHPIVVPPLDHQRLITAQIDAQLTRIEAAQVTLKRSDLNLARHRASVLQAACEGRLVPTEAELARREGRDYEPADKLLNHILAERRARWEAEEWERLQSKGKVPKDDRWKKKYKEPEGPDTSELPELPEGWAWAFVEQLGEVQGGITKGQKRRGGKEYRLVPYLRVANVQRGYLDLSDMKEIEAPADKIERLRLEVGDVLFNEGGDRDKLGRGWVWEGQIDECIHQNHVFRVRPYSAGLESKYLSYFGNSAAQTYFMNQGVQTTNLASLNMTKLKALPVALPPAAEQVRIVQETERQLSLLDRLESEVGSTLKRSQRLRSSVLAAAFGGRVSAL